MKKRTNVEKLEGLGILGDVRERLGAKDGEDTLFDERINSMSARELIGEYTGWVLGSSSWADTILDIFAELSK